MYVRDCARVCVCAHVYVYSARARVCVLARLMRASVRVCRPGRRANAACTG